MGFSSKSQIKSLLSCMVERPGNLIFNVIKYAFSKPYNFPVMTIKTELQNKEEVKTDLLSDEEIAAKLGPDYDRLCSKLNYEADIRNA